MTNKFEWDGEKIKQLRVEEEQKFTPMEILNALAHVRGKIDQMKADEVKRMGNMQISQDQLKSAIAHEVQLGKLEEKCTEIQVKRLAFFIEQLTAECMEKAEKNAKETIAKDPEAYTEDQKKNMSYVNFQRNIATHKKVAEKISSQIISKYVYEEPIFENPFKG